MLDQPLFALLSGSTELDCLTAGEFGTVLDIQQKRLMKALCMTEAPAEDSEDYVLWQQLLADALAVSVAVKNNVGIKSESMRNYSYTMQDFAGTWEMLTKKSPDLLLAFDVCPSGVTFQRDVASHIYGYDYPCGGCGRCHECI